jgi:gentisate 1,2-dioxygenase
MHELRMKFPEAHAQFKDPAIAVPTENSPWAPVTVTREMFDAEIERLALMPRPINGRRESLIVHPSALRHAPALQPGVQVRLSVLNPGESTAAFRHNATDVSFCIRGSGCATVGKREFSFGRYDTWNIPSYTNRFCTNDGSEVQACLIYSNAPLLQYMQVYLAEAKPPLDAPELEADSAARHTHDPRRASPFGTFRVGEDGAMLMPYEKLINPPAVQSPALHWPWTTVEKELKKLESLGSEYIGRRLYLLYNPMTGRTNGTTPNFFATITIRPPRIIDRPHRHVSAAINYYFRGHGYSSVGGNIYRWKAGDLMLSAPGWVVHNHASEDETVCELTIQDQPLNIAMESLLWQENMKALPALLGAQTGFETNRRHVISR